jgi:hypothetical protein
MANRKPLALHAGGYLEELPSGDLIAPAFLGSGTADATRFLRGDQSWASVPAAATLHGVCNGRLTTLEGTPVTTSDRVNQPTVFLSPYGGNRIGLFDGSAWNVRTLPASPNELELTATGIRTTHSTPTGNTTSGSPVLTGLSSTAGIQAGFPVTGTNIPAGAVVISVDSATQITISANATGTGSGITFTFYKPNYDVYAYDSAGTPALEALAWTDNTSRATGLVKQDGVLVKSGDATRRYIGTVRLSRADGFEDSGSRRYIWNYCNRVPRFLAVQETTDNWTYTTATWRPARGQTSNRVEFVLGQSEDPVRAWVWLAQHYNNAGNAQAAVGIGVDSTSSNSAQLYGGSTNYSPNNSSENKTAFYEDYVAAGYHFLQWLEISQAMGTTTWRGRAGTPTMIQSGMMAVVLG